MKNVKHMILASAIATVFAGTAVAAEVGSITTFQSGQAAQASQVNGNFQALITAINDNNSRIAALEAAQAASDSVSDKYYKFRDMGWILAAHKNSAADTQMPGNGLGVADGFARVGFWVGIADLHFASDGTFTISGVDVDVEMFANSSSDIGMEQEDFVGTGTWVQQGNTLTVTFDVEEGEEPDVAEFAVSKGGVALIGAHIGLRDIIPAFGGNYQHEYEGGVVMAVQVDAPAN